MIDPPPAEAHPLGVLLVDDQPLLGRVFERMLAGQPDIRFSYVEDPRRALEEARAFCPTVILVDLVMPEVDGLELVRRFRGDPATRDVPLIVLSSLEEAETKAEAFARGANDYLVKLPETVELLARIRHHSHGYVHRLERDEAYRALEASQKVLRDDLDQAARYVESLLPAPTDDGVVTRWRFIPSASLGGDTLGYHWIDERRFAIYLLDVSGHGVGAALLAVSLLNVLRAQALPRTPFDDPAAVLAQLGESFRTETHSGKFFTIWYGVYDRERRTLTWAGGGHPPAVLLAGGEARQLASTGPMPGILPELAFGVRETRVPPGARLLLFSDGLYEIRRAGDGTYWSHEELVCAIKGMARDGTFDLDALIDRARSYQGADAFEDDLSLLEVTFP